MARPEKTPDQSRSQFVKFRVTDAELTQLDQLATDAGLTVSDYVRGNALNAKPRQTKASPDRAALIKVLGMLGYNRAELNQILKERWTQTFVDPARFDAAFAIIEECADLIHAALEHDYKR